MDLGQYKNLLKEGRILYSDYQIPGYVSVLPYGAAMKGLFFGIIEKEMKNIGYEKYEFPMIIPESFLAKQKKMEDFSKGVLWISEAGKIKLKERWYLRPSGEGAIYPVVKNWIRSYKDLPLKILCLDNFFRRPLPNKYPFIAGSGKIMLEGHSFFINEFELINEIKLVSKTIKKIFKSLCIDTLLVELPKEGNKDISEKTWGLMTVLPSGKGLMLFTAYNQGERYSRLLGIHYKNDKNDSVFVKQTCYGLTERPIGAQFLQFADERGIVIPPKICPIHVAIICFKKGKEIEKNCLELEKEIEKIGLKSKLFFSSGKERLFEITEKQGIPLRICYGPKEIKEGGFEIYNRVINKKINSDINKLSQDIQNEICLIEKFLFKKSGDIIKEYISESNLKKNILSNLKNQRISKISYCGSKECREALISDNKGELLGIAVDSDLKRIKGDKCMICKKEGFISYYGLRM